MSPENTLSIGCIAAFAVGMVMSRRTAGDYRAETALAPDDADHSLALVRQQILLRSILLMALAGGVSFVGVRVLHRPILEPLPVVWGLAGLLAWRFPGAFAGRLQSLGNHAADLARLTRMFRWYMLAMGAFAAMALLAFTHQAAS